MRKPMKAPPFQKPAPDTKGPAVMPPPVKPPVKGKPFGKPAPKGKPK